MRPIELTLGAMKFAEGSALIDVGDTRVVAAASVENRVPRFRADSGLGWVTAEYSMLPRATHTRSTREVRRGHAGGRTMEIQRLIGRALRASVDMEALGERTIRLDCDVIQADGGTRTASITGSSLALYDAVVSLGVQGVFREFVASVSVGIWQGRPVLDLDYAEDSTAGTDMNVVLLESGGFIELQGTAEGTPFTDDELTEMLRLARLGTSQLLTMQRAALEN